MTTPQPHAVMRPTNPLIGEQMCYFQGPLAISVKAYIYEFLQSLAYVCSKKWMPILVLPNLHIFMTRFDVTYFLSSE